MGTIHARHGDSRPNAPGSETRVQILVGFQRERRGDGQNPATNHVKTPMWRMPMAVGVETFTTLTQITANPLRGTDCLGSVSSDPQHLFKGTFQTVSVKGQPVEASVRPSGKVPVPTDQWSDVPDARPVSSLRTAEPRSGTPETAPASACVAHMRDLHLSKMKGDPLV